MMVPRFVSALVLAIGCASAPAVTPPNRQAVLGETLTIESKVLGERRMVNVYLPPDYAKTQARYPVLYMPDGGMAEDFPHVVGSVDVSIKNGVIRPVIVVGIENTERRRDLPGPTSVADEQKAAPRAGGSDKFRAFLREELKPLIAARYRTTPESAIIGESLAGLFAVETLLVEPALFDAYIAADPSLWWNQQALVRGAAARVASWSAGQKKLYVATADAKEMADAFAILKTALDARPEITVTYEPMPHEHHHTIYPTAALHGIRWVFSADAVK